MSLIGKTVEFYPTFKKNTTVQGIVLNKIKSDKIVYNEMPYGEGRGQLECKSYIVIDYYLIQTQEGLCRILPEDITKILN